MTTVFVFRRYEKKFLLTRLQWETLRPLVEAHMDLDEHCLKGTPYLVRNIYLDTSDNELIRRSLDNPVFKEKLRLRKYGSFSDPNGDVFLEIKRKYKGIGTKRRVRLTPEEAAIMLKGGGLPVREDFYARQIIGEIGYALAIYEVAPSVFMSYNRLAYSDKETGTFRLTVDDQILTRRAEFDFTIGPRGKPLLDDNHLLMEVKVGRAMPLWFTKALSGLQIYLTSYSKYGKEFEARIRKELAEDVV